MAHDHLRTPEERHAWSNSRERRALRGAISGVVVLVIFVSSAIVSLARRGASAENSGLSGVLQDLFIRGPRPGTGTGQVFFILLPILALALLWYARSQYQSFRDRRAIDTKAQEVKDVEEDVEEVDPLKLASLWSLNQKRIDYYHEIATSQARTSFRNGQVAISVGFGLLVVTVILVANIENPIAAISSGVIGTAGAGLAGYLGATFIRVQESASVQLRSFFEQPLKLSEFLAAERLISQLPPEVQQEAALKVLEQFSGRASDPID